MLSALSFSFLLATLYPSHSIPMSVPSRGAVCLLDVNHSSKRAGAGHVLLCPPPTLSAGSGRWSNISKWASSSIKAGTRVDVSLGWPLAPQLHAHRAGPRRWRCSRWRCSSAPEDAAALPISPFCSGKVEKGSNYPLPMVCVSPSDID